MTNLLTPLDKPFSKEVENILERYPKAPGGYLLRLFRVYANSVRFLSGKGSINLLDDKSPLSITEREIVILRVTSNLDCEYEWGVHATVFSKAAKLTKQQVAKTRTGDSDDNVWSKKQSILIKSVDEICATAKIQDDTYELFQFYWEKEQQLEILSLCGNYHTVSFVAKTARIPLEELGQRFPEKIN